MREELYGWIRSLAVFYIVFTSILHLVPNKKYDRYVRFFMGMILILMMSAPVFALLGKSEELMKNFSGNYLLEDGRREQMELENLQKLYLMRGVAYELEEKVMESLKKQGITPADVEISIEGEQVSAVIYLEKEPDEDQERRIADGMWEACELRSGEFEIKIQGNEQEAVGGASASGTAAGRGGASGIR